MSNEESTWKEYNTAGAKQEARPRLLKTLERFFANSSGQALDLGCGSGRDSRELLQRGWNVDAVDKDAESLKMMSDLVASYPQKISLIESSFENLQLSAAKYDLINASFSLPFCHPKEFPGFWQKVLASLKPGGIISCELFGDRDTWITHDDMNFHSKSQAEALFSGLKLEAFKESEEDRPSFDKVMKHWHIFIVIARK